MPTYANKDQFTFTSYGTGDMYAREPFDLEDMQAHLTEYPEIEYVSFPHTWYGYAAPIVDLANNKYLETHYSDYVHGFDTQLFIKSELFFSETDDALELIELFFTVQNDYAVISEELWGVMEYEILEEFVREEICFELEIEHEQFDTAMEAFGDSITEYAHVDNDGSTPYMSEDNAAILAARIREVL